MSSPQESDSATLSRWNVETGELLKRSEHAGRYYPLWLAIPREGKWAAVGQQNAIELWNIDTGQIDARLTDVPESVLDVDITPDSSFLVAGSHDKTISVFEMATGKKVLTLTGHKRGVSHVAISSDGRTIASGDSEELPLTPGNPHMIVYWDLSTGKELAHHTGHDDNTTALAFSPNGKYLATGLRDTTALIWEVPFSVRNPAKPMASPTAQELTSAWQGLKDENAEKAYQAMAVLTSAENAAVMYLNEHLNSMQEVDRKQVQDLLKKLDDDEFAVRNQAHEELLKLGDLAGKTVEEFADETESLEAKTRALAVLKGLNSPFVTGPDRLRNLRAIQVLGRIGTPEASTLLEKLSEGTAWARETQEAKRQLKAWRR